jgi:type IV pilus assembly protein PilC
MIKVGEETGQMGKMLHRINDYLTKNEALKQKFLQAMLYPIIVVFISIAAISFLLVFVVPEFETMFKNNKAELPEITQIVLAMSHFLQSFGAYFLLAFFSVILFLLNYFQTKEGNKVFSKFVLKIPFLGKFLKKIFVARFSMILSVLIESKISLLNALSIAKDSIKNDVVSKEIQKMSVFASRGDKLTDSLSKSKLFPEMIVQMLMVGEETAKIDLMLKSVADYYQEEINNLTDKLAVIIEPIILVLLGLIVGAIVISIYLPMFELGNLMG